MQGGIQELIGQRLNVILETRNQQVQPNFIPEMQASSLMDMTLLSDADSDKFHSCYTQNESTVYHDTSQFGMASM